MKFSVPLVHDLKSYSFSFFKHDFIAAIGVALLAIPQSIAYALLANLPIEAGIYSAIFGTIFTAVFSSSKYLISGPSTAVAILIQIAITSILQMYPNVSGPEKNQLVMHILIHMVFLIGLIQILAASLNVGKLLQFVSKSVILGYFSGVGLLILVQQFFYFFGIKAPHQNTLLQSIYYLFQNLYFMHVTPFIIGLLSLSILLFIRKKYPRFPGALFMLVIMGSLAFFLEKWPNPEHIQTLRSVGPLTFQVQLQLFMPDLQLLQKLIPSTATIAFLGILEVFSVSRALSSKSGEHPDSNQQVLSTGISNFFLSLFHGAMPASASISRSLLSFELKGKTRMCALFTGAITWVILYFFWPMTAYIPLASLSALLILSVLTIVDKEQLLLSLRATKEDAFSFFFTFMLCFLFTLDLAFILGIAFSIASYLRKAATPHYEEYAFDRAGRLSIVTPKESKHRRVRIIGIGGELFFGVVDVLQGALNSVAEDPYVKVIVLRLNGVYHMDASMCLAILRLHRYLTSTNRHLIISGLTEGVWQVFHKSQLKKKLGYENLFLSDEARPQLSTWKACLRAQEILNENKNLSK